MNAKQIAVGLGAIAYLAGSASADRVDMIIYENDDNAPTITFDFWIDITATATTVDFTFHNDSAPEPVISEAYFEDTVYSTTNFGAGSIAGTVGVVAFSSMVGDPGGNLNDHPQHDPWQGTSSSYGADSPTFSNSVGTGESLMISFANLTGVTTSEVVQAFLSGDFRIAQHIQNVGDDLDGDGVPGDSSVWMIPAPGTVALLGFAGLVGTRRRR